VQEIDVDDILTRLKDLKSYNAQLAKRLEHEIELPEDDPVTFLVEKIEQAYIRAQLCTPVTKAEAFEELAMWLVTSYKFYTTRLLLDNSRPWCFSFPSSGSQVQH
jgi:hypothetical protein